MEHYEPVIMRQAPRLSLQQHMDVLGLTPYKMVIGGVGVPQPAIERALRGETIAHEAGVKIANFLTKQHGLDIRVKGGSLTPADIGVKTWKHAAYPEHEEAQYRTQRPAPPIESKSALYRQRPATRRLTDATCARYSAQIAARMIRTQSWDKQIAMSARVISNTEVREAKPPLCR